MKKRISALLLALSLCLSMVTIASADTLDPDYGPQTGSSSEPDPGPGPDQPSGSGSGSSSDRDSGYSISTPGRLTGGTIQVRPGSADKGRTVTITVKPNHGYELDKLTVTDRAGNTIDLTDIGNNQFTFVMPGSAVTIDASFKLSNAPAAPSTMAGFIDVPANAYYAAPVAWALEKGITAGTGANTFGPDSPCTRGQIVTFLWRAAGSPAAEGVNPFVDVVGSAYYAQAVQWAVSQGITSGTSTTTFSPDAACTRAQAMAFLYKAKGAPEVTGENGFTDVAADAYYAQAVQWAVSQGITSGTSATTFGPDSQCTRAQIVTFLYHAFA